MKLKKSEDGKRDIAEIEEEDMIIFINGKKGEAAIHWPDKVSRDEMIRLMYYMAQISLSATNRAVDLGIDPDEIEAASIAAYQDWIKNKEKEDDRNYKKGMKTLKEHEENFFEHGYVVSGNNSIH